MGRFERSYIKKTIPKCQVNAMRPQLRALKDILYCLHREQIILIAYS